MLKRIVIGMAMFVCLSVRTARADESLNKALFAAVMHDDKAKVMELISKGAKANAKDDTAATPLHSTAYNKTKEIAEFLISKGADVNAKDKYGESPLHAAAKQGKKDLVEALVAHGADVHAVYTLYGTTPLHSAASGGNKEIVEFLMSKGGDIHANGKHGTPLHEAASSTSEGALEVVQLLISKGADINAKGDYGTALHEAVRGQMPIVEYLVSKGADVNGASEYGETPLHAAAVSGKLEVARFLVSKGADLNARTSIRYSGGGATPLHKAVDGGNKAIVELLVSKGADINAKDESGDSPLHKAASNGKMEIVQSLIAKRADVNARDSGGRTPLVSAMNSGKLDIVQALISAGADISTTDSDGLTLLHKAASNGDCQALEMFLKKGLDINAKGYYERTPLYFAKSTETLAFLLSHGADVNARSKDDNTPLHNAALHESKDYVEVLLAHGALVDAKDKDGNTPLYMAAWYKRADIVKVLLGRGADPRSNDYSPATVAARSGDKAVMDLLLENGVNPNAKAGPGEWPLLQSAVAFGEGNKEAVASLIAHGADVNAKDKGGDVPLHGAGTKEIATMLLAKGADVNAKGQYGETPLHQAVRQSRPLALIEVLLEAGADVDAKDEQGRTPLQMTDEVSDAEAKKKILALLQGHMSRKTNPRKTLKSLLEQFKGHTENEELRQSIIDAVAKVKPSPVIPQEAEDAAGRAAYIFKSAKSEEDMLATAKEYLQAVEAAPWVANYYFNLCSVLEKTPYAQQAHHACKLYLDAAPNADDGAEIRQRIAGLKFAAARNNEQILGRTALREGGLDDLYRSGAVVGQVAGNEETLKLVVDWQSSPPRYRVFRACIESSGVTGDTNDLVDTDTWVTTCRASVSMHMVIKPEGQGYVELSQGAGGLRTTLDELFQQKQKALEKSPIFKDYGSSGDKGERFFVAVVQGGRNNQIAGYDMFESDCNGKLLRQDPRALPDDFLSLETKIASGWGRFNALIDYSGKSRSGCNGKFWDKTGYHFGEKE